MLVAGSVSGDGFVLGRALDVAFFSVKAAREPFLMPSSQAGFTPHGLGMGR